MLELNPAFKFDVREAAALIRDPDTYGLTLMTILLEAYDSEELFNPELDSIELYLQLEEDFRAQITEEGENRIQAAMLAMSTDAFYTDPLVTRATAMALYEGDLGDMVNGVLEPVEYPEILWAVYEVGLLRDDEEPFAPAVQSWIDRLAADTAEDMDGVDGQEVLPYYARLLQEDRERLKDQLRKLGVEERLLSEM
jgi:hypothetical protein